jgi:hypothetical protein
MSRGRTRAQRTVGYLGDPDFLSTVLSLCGRHATLQSREERGKHDRTCFLTGKFVIQVLWFVVGAIYSARLKKREPVLGILLGFAVEGVALLILISASAHY